MDAQHSAPQQPGSVAGGTMPAWMPLLLAALFYICFFSHLDALGFVGPDEPRYASVARAMAETGDWVTPRLNGQPWFEKPVLYYWAAAAAFRVFGVNEFAARLPSALAAALAALALAWAAARTEGFGVARLALLILPTTVGMFSFARSAGPDMLFTAALAAALAAACPLTGNIRGERRSIPLAAAAFGVFLGAAALAKGPAAIVLVGGSAALWAIATRRWRDALRLAHPLAILAFCLTALPWYALCSSRNPGFLRVFLLEHNFQRYVSNVFRHEQPVWFFGPVLLLALLPWSALLLGVAREAKHLWEEKRWGSSPGFFIACWAVFPILFFSFSRSKLPGYILPVVPPLALLLARTVERLRDPNQPFTRGLFAGVGVTLVALATSASYWLDRLPVESGLLEPGLVVAWLAPVMLGGLLVAVLGVLRRPLAALLVGALLMAGLVEAANRRALPQLDPYLSARRAARAGQAPRGTQVSFSAYRLPRAWQYGLNFYLHRELSEWTLQAPRPAWVYTTATGLEEMERQGARVGAIAYRSPEVWLVRVEP